MRIRSVKRINPPTPVPVFDITVHGTENFKLAYGPYVHNSKDVSDAVAGVVYGLTMRREIWGMFNIPIVTLLNRSMVAKVAAEGGAEDSAVEAKEN